MIKIVNLFLLSAILMAAGCSKTPDPEPQLPPITTEGKNILACKINGELFIVDRKWDRTHKWGTHFSIITNGMSITSVKQDPKKEFYIYFSFIDGKNSYPLGSGSNYVKFSDRTNLATDMNPYYTDSVYTGVLNILYYSGEILSGTFEFDVVNSDGKVLHITDGRFDLTLRN
jgi:hypothetical protein